MKSSLKNNDTADSDEDAEAMAMPEARRLPLSASTTKDADEAWHTNRSGR
jgi:hypothetical protein